MRILHKLVNAMTSQVDRQKSSRRRRVRYQGVVEPLENRTSLSQVHAIVPIAPAILIANGPQVTAGSSQGSASARTSAVSGKVEPKDPGGVELGIVAGFAAAARGAIGYAQQPTVQLVGLDAGSRANERS
jgi:hypothetical protein